jgi:Fe2+ transport system protein B
VILIWKFLTQRLAGPAFAAIALILVINSGFEMVRMRKALTALSEAKQQIETIETERTIERVQRVQCQNSVKRQNDAVTELARASERATAAAQKSFQAAQASTQHLTDKADRILAQPVPETCEALDLMILESLK